MDTNVSDTFAACRESFSGDRPHRVWSLIVTIFGDQAQAPGARISGAALGQITELIGVKPETTRVALHRLRKDGWIDSTRHGRESYHRLSEFGRKQSAEASPRIYGPGPPEDRQIHVLIAAEGDADGRARLDALSQTANYVPLGAHILCGLGTPPPDTANLCALQVADMDVPVWLQQRICPADLLSSYSALHDALRATSDKIGPTPDLSDAEIVALRSLIVHSWRRLLLRHPDLPRRFFPNTWPGAECRALVDGLLNRLTVTSIATFDTGPTGLPA